MSLWIWIAVGALGGTFSILRFLVDGVVSERAGSEFPWGTFIVNISGAFALGLLFGTALSGTAYLLAGTACVGSYTTFSTWMFEAHRLGDDDDRKPLLAYLFASLFVGLAAAAVGHMLGRSL
jgi:fluoride exporter